MLCFVPMVLIIDEVLISSGLSADGTFHNTFNILIKHSWKLISDSVNVYYFIIPLKSLYH